jgi:phosphoenolpyruvate carboxylase
VAGHKDLLESDPYLRQRLMLRDSYITALNACQVKESNGQRNNRCIN